MRSKQRTWMLGGAGLISSGVVGMLWIGALRSFPAGFWMKGLSDLVYAGSVIFLAIGLSRAASVVARGPLGIASIVVVGLWPLLETVLTAIGWAPSQTKTGMTPLAYVSLVIPASAALVAVIQVARARTVPAPLLWAPLWVLVGQAFLWVLPQVFLTSSGRDNVLEATGLLSVAGLTSYLAGTVGLGMVAVYLAAKQRPNATQIYRST